jgi:hypothetical protein
MQRKSIFPGLLAALCALAGLGLSAQTRHAAVEYHIYAGSTHAHTQFTWSHGEQWAKGACAGILVYAPKPGEPFVSSWKDGYVKKTCPSIYVVNGWQYPAPSVTLKPDWQNFQGPPAKHFELAKKAGFDFYVSTDHSQEASFWPLGRTSPAWVATKQQAAAATDADFVAIAGFEYSENDGPGGTGHLNVMNSDSILDALAPGIDLPYLYKWLATAKPNGGGPVVASFNHPGKEQYGDWEGRTAAATGIITMLEVINSNKNIHYDAFIRALDKGWKVSPVSGLDNHGLTGIGKFTSRTFVLATSKTKLAILDAMKNRRTYASLDENIQCRYSVNGKIMGSTLDHPASLKFDIQISDPDTGNPTDKITKIDIVKDHGEVVQTYTPDAPDYTVTWKPTIADTTGKYFFVRVWNAGGGDAPGADPAKPIAWLAPVWTGR